MSNDPLNYRRFWIVFGVSLGTLLALWTTTLILLIKSI